MSSPFFSIIIPTYNRADFIPKTIQSVLAQQFQDFEVLVVDDGSTDNTAAVVKAFQDRRILYFKRENAERGAARNFGIKTARGRFIGFLDSDDILLTNHLSVAFNFVQTNNPRVFHLGYLIKDAVTGREKLPQRILDINRQILQGNLLSCNGVFIERETATKNLFNELRSLASLEDWELWIRLAARFPFKYSGQVTSLVMNHDSRSVFSVDIEKIKLKARVFEDLVMSDEENQRVFGRRLRFVLASVSTYVALHLALAKAPTHEILRYLWRGIRLNPGEIFRKRFLVIVKITIGL